MDTFKLMSNLVADAEDLLARLRYSSSPEIDSLRSKVNDSIAEIRRQAKVQLQKRGSAASGLRSMATAAVRDNPRAVAALGAAVAAALFYFMFVKIRMRE